MYSIAEVLYSAMCLGQNDWIIVVWEFALQGSCSPSQPLLSSACRKHVLREPKPSRASLGSPKPGLMSPKLVPNPLE